MEFWSFWVKNLRLIGWGGRSNADAHAPEIMRELIELAESGRVRPGGGRDVSVRGSGGGACGDRGADSDRKGRAGAVA